LPLIFSISEQGVDPTTPILPKPRGESTKPARSRPQATNVAFIAQPGQRGRQGPDHPPQILGQDGRLGVLLGPVPPADPGEHAGDRRVACVETIAVGGYQDRFNAEQS